MRDTLNAIIKGKIEIYQILDNGEKVLILERDNAIQPEAVDVIRRCIAGESNKVDTIQVYESDTLKSEKITSHQILTGFDNKVKFISLFDENSFVGGFDELRLVSSTTGNFSKVTGLSLTKQVNTRISIEWVLTIIIN